VATEHGMHRNAFTVKGLCDKCIHWENNCVENGFTGKELYGIYIHQGKSLLLLWKELAETEAWQEIRERGVSENAGDIWSLFWILAGPGQWRNMVQVKLTFPSFLKYHSNLV
jgi:hypothetical protein